MLRRLETAGCRTVELGVQTFGAEALERSLRGYGPDCARLAMGLVGLSRQDVRGRSLRAARVRPSPP